MILKDKVAVVYGGGGARLARQPMPQIRLTRFARVRSKERPASTPCAALRTLPRMTLRPFVCFHPEKDDRKPAGEGQWPSATNS